MSLRTRQQRRRRSCKLATANKEKGKTSIFVLGVKALNLHCQKVVVMIEQGKNKGGTFKTLFHESANNFDMSKYLQYKLTDRYILATDFCSFTQAVFLC